MLGIKEVHTGETCATNAAFMVSAKFRVNLAEPKQSTCSVHHISLWFAAFRKRKYLSICE